MYKQGLTSFGKYRGLFVSTSLTPNSVTFMTRKRVTGETTCAYLQNTVNNIK